MTAPDDDITVVPHDRSCLVLAVDDEAVILWGTAQLLESLGYRVIQANSGAAGLEILQREPGIDVLLTDFQMPNMSGIELATAAHAVRADLPVIITTGHIGLQQRKDCEWATMAKPFTRDELAEAMRVALADHGAVAKA